MKVINLFGGPGSGKSTTAAGLFYALKLENQLVELITEYAKDLVYSSTLTSQIEHFPQFQHFIFAEQNRRQYILKGKVDWAITDSPLLLSHVYSDSQQFNQEAFLNLVSDTFRMYDNISFFLDRPEAFTNVGRVHNLEQSIEVDNKILTVLNTEQVEYTRIPADKHTVDRILSHLIF